jgi:drug/metabolite transporter superfamily protein YnfA
MFTIAAAVTHVGALPVGSFLDQFRSKMAAYVGSVLLTIGAIIIPGMATELIDPPLWGYVFLALGGRFIFTSALTLHRLFPERGNLVGALLAGFFDASSAVFFVFRWLHDGSEAITLRWLFLMYLLVPLLWFWYRLL